MQKVKISFSVISLFFIFLFNAAFLLAEEPIVSQGTTTVSAGENLTSSTLSAKEMEKQKRAMERKQKIEAKKQKKLEAKQKKNTALPLVEESSSSLGTIAASAGESLASSTLSAKELEKQTRESEAKQKKNSAFPLVEESSSSLGTTTVSAGESLASSTLSAKELEKQKREAERKQKIEAKKQKKLEAKQRKEAKNFKVVSSEQTSPKFIKTYVYHEAGYESNNFIPSGWMGDYGDMRLSTRSFVNPKTGSSCIKIAYSAKQSQGSGWAGIYWQNPANNWGTENKGLNLSGAKYVEFYVRGEKGGEIIDNFKIGGITGTYPDTTDVSFGPILLTKKWKKYRIKLKGKDLSHIIGGFCFVVTAESNPDGAIFYFDEIIYK